MKSRSVTEYALDEIRGAPNALRAAQFVAEVLLESALSRSSGPNAERIASRFTALNLHPSDGRTARGAVYELLARGPTCREDLAILNCFFTLGIVHRIESLPRENRRGYAREVVTRCEFLLESTVYTPFEFLPIVAPTELGIELWDALVTGLIEEVNRSGSGPSAGALVRAECLRHLPQEVRRAYTRRILSDCFDSEASLRFAALLTALEEPREEPSTAAAGHAPTPPPLPAPIPAERVVRPPQRHWTAAATEPSPLAAVRGEIAPGPAGLLLRAVLLLSGILLLRDLGALLLRALGVRRTTSLILAEGELVAEERLRIFGKTVWQRRRAYAAPAVAGIARDVPYGRLYLLLGLSIFTLVGALVLSIVSPDSGDLVRYGLLAGCGAVLAGIALDLTRFLASYLQRGHCTVTIAVHGGDTYRLAGVPTPEVARFAEVARLLRGRASGGPMAPKRVTDS